MMFGPVGRRALRTFLWTAFLHFIITAAEQVKDVSSSSVLQREKREWQWNMLIVYEEKQPQNPPEAIGKLKNTHFNKNAKFKLLGDGAEDTFDVNAFGEVLVLKKLDRETISKYTLKAQIIDMTTGQKLEDDTEFTILVQDINDNKPIFSETYIGSVNERARSGAAVLRVHASDKDDPSTVNGMVTYKLLNATNLFTINPTTGEISTTVGTLDRETQNEYKLTVQASDMPGLYGGQSASTVVTININDINDNQATFSQQSYHFSVKENEPAEFKIGTLQVKDGDEIQNKNPTFEIDDFHKDIFYLVQNDHKDAVLIQREGLDYETKPRYTFTVKLKEEDVIQPPDNSDVWMSAQIHISVIDVDEPPLFSQREYTFNVTEGQTNIIVGSVSAKDTDKTSHKISYSITDPDSPVNINGDSGQITLKKPLDWEEKNEYKIQVTAEELSTNNLKSYAVVKIKVLDVNEHDPELANGNDVYVCESDQSGMVIHDIVAIDKDDNPEIFRFSLVGTSSNFSLHDNQNNTASIILKHGGFVAENSMKNVLEIEITDGGNPPRTSIRSLTVHVCECGSERRPSLTCSAYSKASITASALIAILLCIVTILVIVILFVLHKRYKKEALVTLGKPSDEIHEQLVAYDEEGGGEMDTNIYDVSVLTSARSDTRLGLDVPPPAMYAVVKKPSACKGDMAAMIEVKKDEADHDRDGIPYDTLHIYGYEGSESIAGSLSSLGSSSSFGSDLDYDFLNDWGPRFRTLAQIYGSEENTSY